MAEPIGNRFPELASVYNALSLKTEVSRFVKKDSSTAVGKAEEAVSALLRNHPELCPCFSVERLRDELDGKSFLVIKGRAVCLSQGRPSKNPHKEDDLSERLVQQPVRCSQGHLFDLSTIRFWAKKNGGLCPFPPEHPLGSLAVDRTLEQEIRLRLESKGDIQQKIACVSFKSLKVDLEKKKKEVVQARDQAIGTQQRDAELIRLLNVAQKQATSSGSPTAEKVVRLVVDGVKVSGKAAATALPRMILSASLKGAPRAIRRIAMRALRHAKFTVYGMPFIGLGVGVGVGIYRLCRGQWVKATGELLSGAASCLSFIPGLGPAAAIGTSVFIDTVVTVGDVYDAFSKNSQESAEVACQVLGIEFNKNLKKAEVDEAFRTRIDSLNAGTPEQHSKVIKDYEDAKKQIYDYCHWEEPKAP